MIQDIENLHLPNLWYWYIYFALLFNMCMCVLFSYMRATAAKFDTPYEKNFHREFYSATTYQRFNLIFLGQYRC